MTFGEKLSSLRKQANLTQRELADKLSVSRQAVSKWEKNIGLPDLDNISKLSKIFNVSVDELLDYKLERLTLNLSESTEYVDRENTKWKNVSKFVLKKYPNAENIYLLQREINHNVWTWLLDFFIGAGTLDVADLLKSGIVYSFLIEENNKQYLILLNKDTLLKKELKEKFDKKKMVIDGYKYIKQQQIK